MENLIEIERIPYEEPYHINLLVSASNRNSRGHLEIYDNAKKLHEIASRLEEFPKGIQDQFMWELGSEKPEDRFAFYFLF
tara:strand:+ start:126 stop:365 length:240 start_codon:yes stop_codon:yes gene_type:complete